MSKNTNLNMNASVSYLATNDSVGIVSSGSAGNAGSSGNYTTLGWDYWRIWPEYIQPYYTYPTYINTTRYEDTYKKAFSIAKLLLKKNLLVSRKLKDFIGLVEEIAKEL